MGINDKDDNEIEIDGKSVEVKKMSIDGDAINGCVEEIIDVVAKHASKQQGNDEDEVCKIQATTFLHITADQFMNFADSLLKDQGIKSMKVKNKGDDDE